MAPRALVCRCGSENYAYGMCRPCYARLIRTGFKFPKLSDEERFWSHVTKRESGCWEWDNPRSCDGYGSFRVGGTKGKSWLSHRWSYIQAHGEIPDGLDLDHLCRNRRCVNPDHLEPVTRAENSLRGMAPLIVAWRTDTCPRGHSLLDAYVVKKGPQAGRRNCRSCVRDRWAAKAADPEFRRKRAAYELARKRKQREQVA